VTLSNDPWINYRKQNGEFRKWLHVWCYKGNPAHHENNDVLWYPWAPLPWVLPADQPLNGETLTAMFHMGVTARWPAEWPRFDPDLFFMRKYPIYGMILPTSSEGALLAHLRKVELQSLDHNDFMHRMNRRYVLFPQLKERVNANSRSAKDRIPFV
jgi:hypothetical protein